MYAVFTLVALAAVWLCWRRLNRSLYSDALSPFNLLFYFWIAPFILSLANLSALQSGIDAKAMAVIVLSTAILGASCLLPAMLGVRPNFAAKMARTVRIKPAGILCFYGLSLLALYFAEFSERELPLVAYLLGGASDSNLHTAGKDSKLQVIAYGIHSASIFVFYLWLHEKRRLMRSLYLTLSLTVIAVGLVKASKSDIFIPILSFGGLIYYHYRIRNRSLPMLYKMILLATVIVVISITSIRLEGVGLTGGYTGLIEFRYSDQLGEVPSEIASIVYGYTALGFQNFSNYINSHFAEFRIGTSLFRPILSAFMMGDVASSMSVPVDTWNVVSDAANTGTFLTPLYIEGGLAFCLLGSLVYGLIVNFVYLSFRTSRSVAWIFVYISLLFPWTWLFFTNAFSVLSIYVNLFYVAVLSWLFVSSQSRSKALDSRTQTQERSPSGAGRIAASGAGVTITNTTS